MLRASNITGLSVRIDDGIEQSVGEVEERLIEYLRNELAEFVLLHQEPEVKSVYEMTYEEYMELPGNVRL